MKHKIVQKQWSGAVFISLWREYESAYLQNNFRWTC
jgi:hypothetical protein